MQKKLFKHPIFFGFLGLVPILVFIAFVVMPELQRKDGEVGFSVFVPLFTKMGKGATDTEKYARRMASLISDTPECKKYKDTFLNDGHEATSMNAAFAALIIKNKDAADKAGCSKV